jgi:hypothetical protein
VTYKYPVRRSILIGMLALVFMLTPFVAPGFEHTKFIGYVMVVGIGALIALGAIHDRLFSITLESDRITAGALSKRVVLLKDTASVDTEMSKGGPVGVLRLTDGSKFYIDGGLQGFRELMNSLEQKSGTVGVPTAGAIEPHPISPKSISDYIALIRALVKGIVAICAAGWIIFEIREIALRQLGLISNFWFVVITGALMGWAAGYAMQGCRRELLKLRDAKAPSA